MIEEGGSAMLSPDTHLRLNEEEVAAKVIDGEAIMINLSNGVYYSMDEVGGLIWEMIEGRYSLQEMVAEIIARYDVSPRQAQADVERLVGELFEENLVMPSNDELPRRENQPQERQQRLPYEPPNLNIYRDMADLLALDPPMPSLQEITWKEPDDRSFP
jgi:hypothetical protein